MAEQRQVYRGNLAGAAKWLLLGIPGAIVFFATVPPTQATSNIASWLTYFGVDRVPAILADRWADLGATALGVLLLLPYLLRVILGIRAIRKADREGKPRPFI